MELTVETSSTSNYGLVGTVSGALSTFIFMFVHDLTISNIWFATPLTLLYTFISSVLISLIYPRSWTNFGAVLLTTSLLVLLLGLNVSVLGFVEISLGDILLVLKFFGLIVLLNVVFALFFMVLQVLGRKISS